MNYLNHSKAIIAEYYGVKNKYGNLKQLKQDFIKCAVQQSCECESACGSGCRSTMPTYNRFDMWWLEPIITSSN